MSIELAPLPWRRDALAPVVSGETIDLHYGKHHAAYVETLNKLVRGSAFDAMGLPAIVRAAKANGADQVFDNAAQAWNHQLYWASLSPHRNPPEGDLEAAIRSVFGSKANLETRLVEAGMQRFGSGWVWLVADAGRLDVVSTSNADTPMADGRICLLTLDVWEHAYYIDYHDRRADHLNAVVGLIDWKAAAVRLDERPLT